MPSNIDEKQLIEELANGSLTAFEQLLSIYERPIFNYLRRLTSNQTDAEDLTQETFIKLYRFHRSLNPDKNFKSFLYKIATNTTYDFLRKKMSHEELFIIDDPESNFETIDDEITYKNMEQREMADIVEAALSKIKPIYRTVLLLLYQKELTYEEIAQFLKLPINTIKTYIHRAKLAFKQNFSK